MLKSEGIFVSRRGVAKFIRNIRNLLVCSCWASSSKTRERNNTRDIRACIYRYSPVPGTGKLKLNENLFRSSPVQLPFNSRSPPVFFKRAPVEQIVWGTFFDAYHTSRLLYTNDDSYEIRSVHTHKPRGRL